MVFGAMAMTVIAMGCAQGVLPASVRQFLQERSTRQQVHRQGIDRPESYRYVPSRQMGGREMVDAFVGIDDEDAVALLERAGAVIGCVFDGFVTAQLPVERLEDIMRLRGVNDVEVSSLMWVSTDSTRRVTHVDQVLDGEGILLPDGYDGRGVIIGIVDNGFDYQHRAFRSNGDPSRTRISRVYSTTLETGHPARYNKTIVLPGSVFMGDEIYSLTTDSQGSTHGTHTASIAAGCHVNGYGGMAPGAEIVLCSVSMLDGGMSAVEVTNCLRYIVSYADSVGKPCVMSLSVSTPNGRRDGQDYLSKAVAQITGPGRIFVISAGNDGGRKAYAHKLATQASPMNILFKTRHTASADSSYHYYGMFADIWMRQPSQNFYYRFHVLDQRTNEVVWESEQLSSQCRITTDEFGDYFGFDAGRDSVGYVEGEPDSSYGKHHLLVTVRNLINREYMTVNGVKCGRYAIGMSIYPRDGMAAEIDAWAINSNAGLSSVASAVVDAQGHPVAGFYSAPSDSCCIGTYTVGDSTISAGAFAARNSYYSMALGRMVNDNAVTVGDIAAFSAYQAAGAGPTGKALPTICAPGITVVAAGSRYSYFAQGGNNSTVMRSDDGSYWGVMSGTSMAAPTVAGIIALWLQANPCLSVGDIKDVLIRTASKDRFTQGAKAARFGPNGKIDAFLGMKYILKRMNTRKGDVNGDGIIDVGDVTTLISHVLGQGYDEGLMAVADMDDSGYLDVADVIRLISMILNQ